MEQAADVADILASLGVGEDTPQIEVWNKLDLVDASQREALASQAAQRPRVLPVSALTGEGVESLLSLISATLDADRTEATLTIPFSDGRKRAWLHEQNIVQSETEDEDGWHLTVRWTARQQNRWRRL
jgi:GTP-binding protein HflX